MKAETITLKWKENEKWYEKQINRQNFVNIMSSIKAGFDGNNEVSTYLSKVGEEMTELRIDKDRNTTRDIPFIMYITEEGQEKVYEILRRHTIMWSILNGYCK